MKLLEEQREFFIKGNTLGINFRIEQLKKLKDLVKTHQSEIIEVLQRDIGKSPMETFITEISLVEDEILGAIKNLKKWMRRLKVSTPALLRPARSEIYREPYGCILIITPWNYPFLLLVLPLIGAMSAGNCAIVKPSEIATHTQNLMVKLINQYFPSHYIYALKAAPEQTEELLKEKFDFIFFTGGMRIGQIVMEAAAKQLTPVTLEIGGKSPCIVDQTIDLDYAARRVAWGKLINVGQTCIAPDYVFIHESCKHSFVKKLEINIDRFYGENPEKSSSYGHIINKKQFDRLNRLIQTSRVLFGGKTDPNKLYISPTLIDGADWTDPIMQEEIFGPILPILTFSNIEEVILKVKQQPKPLALYLFTKNKEVKKKVLDQISFGGGCVNDCLFHFVNENLPFGGIGARSLGKYRGKYSFDLFSQQKSVLVRSILFEVSLMYPPYSENKLWWLRWVYKIKRFFSYVV